MNTDTTQEPTPAEIPEPDAETPESTPPDSEALQAEVEKLRDAALRARAELDNYRKRTVREKEEAIRYANGSLLESLLPVLDNFELGLAAAKNAPEAASIVVGLEMVRRQLEDFGRQHGLEAINAVGQPFDPNLHEAVGHEPHAEVPDGVVISQMRCGYKLKDRLLRPATVVVSKGAE